VVVAAGHGSMTADVAVTLVLDPQLDVLPCLSNVKKRVSLVDIIHSLFDSPINALIFFLPDSLGLIVRGFLLFILLAVIIAFYCIFVSCSVLANN
jgi:hypothetical protein